VAFCEAGGVGLIFGDEVFLDGGCHCDALSCFCSGEEDSVRFKLIVLRSEGELVEARA
jgi:hypothetical protein